MDDAGTIDDGKERSRKWVTVASFSHAAMANVAKLQLDAEEIPNFIDNEHTAMLLWNIQSAAGGVRLKVPEEFEEEAREVLRNEDPEPEDQDSDDDDGEQFANEGYALRYAPVTRCPKCHSTDTEPLSWGWRVAQAVVIVVLGLSLAVLHPLLLVLFLAYLAYFLFSKPNHRCLRCGHRFNATPMAE